MFYVPSVFRNLDFDDELSYFPHFGFSYGTDDVMKTDVTKKDGKYHLDMNLPGVAKENIKISLHEGYLTISANRDDKKEEKNDKGEVIRSERYTGSCSRQFYVGDSLKPEDVSVKYEDGVLKVDFPDVDAVEHKEPEKLIEIK